MDHSKPLAVSELASHVDGRVVGDGATLIHRVASLEAASEGDIAYVEDAKFFDAAGASKASCVIVPAGADVQASCRIEVKKPKLAFALVAALLHPAKKRKPEIHPTAVVADNAAIDSTAYVGPQVVVGEYAVVGAGTRIEAGVVIGANVTVGRECVLHPNVVLYDGVSIGNRVILHAGVCLG